MTNVSIRTLATFFTFLVIVSNHFTQADLIDHNCKKTRYPDLCIETLRSNNATVKTDVKDFCIIILEVSFGYASKTRELVKNLRYRIVDQDPQQCLDSCLYSYDFLIVDINRGINNLRKDIPSMVGSSADMVASRPLNCQEECDAVGVEIPFSKMNTKLHHLGVILEDLVHLVGSHKTS
ncbi:uncharacterized protein LOC124930482 [Impatiens glandulifera]|uniref:uncharacterized protein LOC124930482 n=1 Tax=Impatiens glandulifera TaxID=253017 RepID=UPI001FB0B2C1|nr:uncharacterized protein LOC124930482 [Impatiens glandulifera]